MNKQRVDLWEEIIINSGNNSIICPSINQFNEKKTNINIPVRNTKCNPSCIFDLDILTALIFENNQRNCVFCGIDINIEDYYIDIHFEYALKTLKIQHNDLKGSNIVLNIDGTYHLETQELINSDSISTNEFTKIFKDVNKTLDERLKRKIEEFNEVKRQTSENEVVRIEIDPQLKKDIEKSIDESIKIGNCSCISIQLYHH